MYSIICSGSEYDYSYVLGINSDVYNYIWDKLIIEELIDYVYSIIGFGNDVNLYDNIVLKELNLR